ncbi:MAG: DUF4037 domain-containing protein [Bifidobacterium sp.]|nr:DUF4037 domain-containing protein [Bifidobacterium sp.]
MSKHHDDAQAPQGSFDVREFLSALDGLFDSHATDEAIDDFLHDSMTAAENAGDLAGLLSVLNETMGFYRSRGRHKENQWIVQRAIELALRMGLEGTEAWATTLINAATAQRAAGNYDQAADLYDQALDTAQQVYGADDRRLAALHNNRSMLFSETGDATRAIDELRQALAILERSSLDASRDVDVASTCTNLALILAANAQHAPARLADARYMAKRSLDIYAAAGARGSAHYASALAGAAQVAFLSGDATVAADYYRKALRHIADTYGKDTDYYRTTEANLKTVEEVPATGGKDTTDGAATVDASAGASTDTPAEAADAGSAADATSVADATPAAPAPKAQEAPVKGLQLSKAYWEQVVRPMLAQRYPEYLPRIAAGLVGHGSECYGFDDALSHDHDFGPRVCLWLTKEDFDAVGERMQADYDALPRTFMGVARSETTPRAQAQPRDGVLEIATFFESITGYPTAPAANQPAAWLTLDEATLAAATNGKVFADPLGAFSRTRQSFKLMPDDVRLSLVSRRLGMLAQSGQYNLPRMLERGDGAAAWLCVDEFVRAAASYVFLTNNPATVGYAPYYKWLFAAWRRLSARPFAKLADVCGQCERLMRLASAACFGGAGFAEGGKGSRPAADEVTGLVGDICAAIVAQLNADGLSLSDADFLEWQRPYVESHIESGAACLHSL